MTVEPSLTINDIITMQQQASSYEQSKWVERGAKCGQDGLWRFHDGRIVATTKLLGMLIADAHDVDHCSRGEVKRKIVNEGFWSPYLQEAIDDSLTKCHVCSLHNIKKPIISKPLGHIPVPEGPFKHLVIDYIDMIKTINRHRYVLVVVCRFSRWVEACSGPGPDEKTVIKFFTREIIPRFGIPDMISSDNGAAFTAKTWGKIMQALGIKKKLGCVYHPQSQGLVERANGTLKGKIAKICASTSLNWFDALPIALMQMRSQQNRSTHLTPHEMLTGRPMPVPKVRANGKGPPLDQLREEIRHFMEQLSLIHKTIYKQEKEQEKLKTEVQPPPPPIQPGDWIYLKVFRRSCLQPRAEGPYRVAQVTPTAVRVQGSKTWYHLTACFRAPDPGPDPPDAHQSSSARASSPSKDGGTA